MTVTASVKVTKNALPELTKSLKALAGLRCMVGVPGETADRDEPGQNNAILGYIHEQGAPEAHIPPRPFLLPTVRDKKDKIISRLRQAGEYAINGKPETTMKALEGLGLEMQSAVRMKIVIGPFVPLSDRTLDARLARGVRHDKPLIDTGNLIASITYVIRNTKSGKDLRVGQRRAWYGTEAAQKGMNVNVTPTRAPTGGLSSLKITR